MISLDVKAESRASSPIGLAIGKEAKEESTLSFSELLRGAKDSKGEKGIQNGSFIVSLGATKEETKDVKLATSKETLLSLLKQDDKAVSVTSLKEKIAVLEFNPTVTEKLSVGELKTLINDAKQFLKQKIINSDDFKMKQVKDLPKTLKGLADMAKSFGIDMSKITLEEVRATPKALAVGKVVERNTEQSAAEAVGEKVQKISKETPKAEVDTPDIVDIKAKTPKMDTTKTQSQMEVAEKVNLKETTKEVIKENVRLDDKRIDIIKEVKATPLFKATEKTELTTEQIVQTKQFKVEEKTPKSKADETLKLLLRGEKPSQALGNTTADFSVATARVIAPTATSEVSKSLEQLLHGGADESTSKLDGLTTHKADSFEVKLNEAKQMVKYLSQDVKTAIEDYKSPFTRVKVQLNPQKMGEVDVTIVQRGKNLHISISSNSVAINTLAMNANELKTQLTNNGIQNASLNFNNSEQNSEQNTRQQQQHRQNEQKADEEYNYFDSQEQNEEILNSLEIVVPNYA